MTLIRSINHNFTGSLNVPPSGTFHLAHSVNCTCTNRQKTAYGMLEKGMKQKDIALSMNVSNSRVHQYIRHVAKCKWSSWMIRMNDHDAALYMIDVLRIFMTKS